MRFARQSLLIVVLAASGCGDGGPKRVHLNGTVTFNGKPIPIGEIYFDPDATKGKDGPQGFARIVNGEYDTRKGGLAPTAGPHVVRILGFDGQPRPDRELVYGPRLFPEHSTSATVPDRDSSIDFTVPGRK